MEPQFCPNPLCHNHNSVESPADHPWFAKVGFHTTKVVGTVQRYRCGLCRKTFSDRTFSIDYYAKKTLPYAEILNRSSSGECVSAIARNLGARPGVVTGKISRLARNCLAMHATMEDETPLVEDIVADGFESFDRSQYFPNNIALVVGKESQHIYSFSHTTLRRKGGMTKSQRAKRATLEAIYRAPRDGAEKSLAEALAPLSTKWDRRFFPTLRLYTDEHRAYPRAIAASGLGVGGGLVHETRSSRAPRTVDNDLFAVNYIDRELRKDKAEYHRETTCFVRNVANGLERLSLYLVWHNYQKPRRVKEGGVIRHVHAEYAGLPFGRAKWKFTELFVERAFLSRLVVPEWVEKVWKRRNPTPLKEEAEYLPAFALG